MTPNDVKNIVGDLPHMTLKKGEFIYNFLTKNKCINCLELGFYHGVSSLYIGAAMKENNGKLTTIDLEKVKENKPNIEELVTTANLSEYITYYYEHKSYTWRMMKMLEEGKEESFDFCYVDGGHNIDDVGFSFYLASRLLKPNGWILFNDLNWSLGKKKKEQEPNMPSEIYTAEQVKMVYEILVKNDKRYANYFIPIGIPSWGFAQKIFVEYIKE